jgi:hypothetical protein
MRGKTSPAQLVAVAQLIRGVPVLLVLQESAHQLLPGIDLLLRLVVLHHLALLGGEEHLGLDVGEVRGQHQELRRHVDLQRLQGVQHLDVALGDERDGDVEDVHLVLADEVEQQVQGPGEVRQLHPEQLGQRGVQGPVVLGDAHRRPDVGAEEALQLGLLAQGRRVHRGGVGTRCVEVGGRRADLGLGRHRPTRSLRTDGGLVRAGRPVLPVFLALARHRSTQRSRIGVWWQETSLNPRANP